MRTSSHPSPTSTSTATPCSSRGQAKKRPLNNTTPMMVIANHTAVCISAEVMPSCAIERSEKTYSVMPTPQPSADLNTSIHETSDALYQRTFDVCMTSVFWTMRAAYPHLKRSGRGSVINFASNAGTEGMAGNAVYAAAKEAILRFEGDLLVMADGDKAAIRFKRR